MDGNLRQLFRAHLKDVFFTSVETGATGRGTPDSYAIYKGSSCWIEFKQTKAWKTTLTPEQISWHLRHSRNGGRSFIAVRRQHFLGGNNQYDELWIMDGNIADICTSLRDISLGLTNIWSGGAARWDWNQIRQVLFGTNSNRQ